MRKFLRKCLHEVPSSLRSISNAASGVVAILTWIRSQEMGRVNFRDNVVYQSDLIFGKVFRGIVEGVVTETGLNGLVQVKHVDFVVPRPFVQVVMLCWNRRLHSTARFQKEVLALKRSQGRRSTRWPEEHSQDLFLPQRTKRMS